MSPQREQVPPIVEQALARVWPRWRRACKAAPPALVPYLRVGVRQAERPQLVLTQQLYVKELPDQPEQHGASRAELAAAVDATRAAGGIPVLVGLEDHTAGDTNSWYVVVAPERGGT
jgi:hypothetical protein